jgi:nitrite reductase/ring-hydroxylating ferredoxin subunit
MTQNWTKVAAVDEVPEDGTLLVDVGDAPVCLYNLAGKIYATHDTCTHGNASLADGFVDGELIECPLHQGTFHIPTGRAAGVPCKTDIKIFPVKIEGGSVFVGSSE